MHDGQMGERASVDPATHAPGADHIGADSRRLDTWREGYPYSERNYIPKGQATRLGDRKFSQIQPSGMAYWERLAGRPTVAPAVVVEKLRTRQDQLAGSERRFEATPGLSFTDVPSATDEARTPGKTGSRPGTPAPGVAPEAAQEPGDFASRLMRAKKRALEDRDKKDKP